ncbi:hypothetical protein Bca52824_036894 [Brassica carinata]|uniref:Uncharacterized protein n=1 Tax=Brassica carinata TaxID=52824 RepID=A0A8X7V366_BRACI|nr:hypothetical protein Bca52824_036894 [Brassica carinata]
MDASQSSHICTVVSQLVESTLCWEALSVLEALLQSCSPVQLYKAVAILRIPVTLRTGLMRKRLYLRLHPKPEEGLSSTQ